MFDRVTDAAITAALDEMIACLGVSEEIPFHDLLALLYGKGMQTCVQEIATRLRLPIRIILSCVPNDFTPNHPARFRSRNLVQTDETGHGVEGIVAQVSTPPGLPMFGSPGLVGFPVEVRVTDNWSAHPETFITVMVHELSHVLLASLWSPHKHSELHTDLVPILLGFREVGRRGRTVSHHAIGADGITQRMTTYGYLSEVQFDLACKYVTGVLERRQGEKMRLLEVVEKVRRKLKKASGTLAAYRDYMQYLDQHIPERMKGEHARRVVELHGKDYGGEWQSRIAPARESMEAIEAFVRPLNHYTTDAVERLRVYARQLECASDELGRVTGEIAKDARILQKYVGIYYRLFRALRCHFQEYAG